MQDMEDKFAGLVAQDLKAVEHGFDEVITRAGVMLQTLGEGRRRAGLSACVGQQALVNVGAAINGAIAARGEMVKAHNRFARDARSLGLDWTVLGPLETKPDDDVKESPRPQGLLSESL